MDGTARHGTRQSEVSVQADFAPSSLIEARRSFPITLLVVCRTFCYRRPIRHSTLVIIDRHLPAEGHYHAGLLVVAVGVGWGGGREAILGAISPPPRRPIARDGHKPDQFHD